MQTAKRERPRPAMFTDMFDSPHLLALIHVCHDRPGAWDDVSLSRALQCVPSQARGVLDDLWEWGMIQPVGIDTWAATHRGTQNCRIYVQQTPRAHA